MRSSFLTPLLLILALGAAGPALADSATPAQRGAAEGAAVHFSWNTPEYRSCGFSCLYKKANELQSLDAIYEIRKLDRLQGATDSEKRANLKAFCLTDGTESTDQCFQRYRDFTMLRLKKMVSSLAHNSAAAAEYYDPRTRIEVINSGVDEEIVQRQLTPHVPTFEELQKQRVKESEVLASLGAQDYVEWQGQVPNAPAQDDFVMYREVPKDPSQPEGAKVRLPDTSCGHSLCYDMSAFHAAKAEFEGKRADYERMDGPYAHVQRIPARWDNPKTLDAPSQGAESIQEFNEARVRLINVANEAIVGHGPAAVVGPVDRRVAQAGATASASTAAPPTEIPATGLEQVVRPPVSKSADDLYVGMTPETLQENIKALEHPQGAAATPAKPAPRTPAGAAAPANDSSSTTTASAAPIPAPAWPAPSETVDSQIP